MLKIRLIDHFYIIITIIVPLYAILSFFHPYFLIHEKHIHITFENCPGNSTVHYVLSKKKQATCQNASNINTRGREREEEKKGENRKL